MAAGLHMVYIHVHICVSVHTDIKNPSSQDVDGGISDSYQHFRLNLIVAISKHVLSSNEQDKKTVREKKKKESLDLLGGCIPLLLAEIKEHVLDWPVEHKITHMLLKNCSGHNVALQGVDLSLMMQPVNMFQP